MDLILDTCLGTVLFHSNVEIKQMQYKLSLNMKTDQVQMKSCFVLMMFGKDEIFTFTTSFMLQLQT